MPDPWGDTSGSSYGYNPNNDPSNPNSGGFWGGLRDWFTGANNNGNQPGGGGGGGVGFGGGATPSAAATAASKTTALLPWLQFAYGVIESRKKGSFQMPPMTPEQQQMLNYAMGVLQGTPQQKDYMPQILGYDLGHPATLDFEALRRGETGFKPASHMPSDELAKILSRAQTPPQTSATTGDGSDGVGLDKAGFGGRQESGVSYRGQTGLARGRVGTPK